MIPPANRGVADSGRLLPLGRYLKKRQNEEVDYVATRPILGLCVELVRSEGVQESRRWWEQRGGVQAAAGGG